MYAPVHPPPAPRPVPGRGWTVSMRVLFTALSVLSAGLLLWAPLLRLAIVRRRAADWWLTGGAFVLVCVLVGILGRDGSDEATGIDNVLIPLLLLAAVAAPAYYLVADVRHHQQPTLDRPATGYVPTQPGYGYGYPYASTTPMATPVPGPSGPAPGPQAHPYAQPRPPAHPAPPQQSAHPRRTDQPQRIDQVRAELDELSDYLRKEEGR